VFKSIRVHLINSHIYLSSLHFQLPSATITHQLMACILTLHSPHLALHTIKRFPYLFSSPLSNTVPTIYFPTYATIASLVCCYTTIPNPLWLTFPFSYAYVDQRTPCSSADSLSTYWFRVINCSVRDGALVLILFFGGRCHFCWVTWKT